MGGMDDNAVIREVADRLTAIGRLGAQTAAGRMSPLEALDIAQDLVDASYRHARKDT